MFLSRFGQFGELAAHEALHGEDRVAGIGHCLTLRSLANKTFAALGEGDDGWRGACAF